MSFEKKFAFLFCVGFLGLVQVNASQIVAAVLLNEDGSPRCKIVQEEHDVFSSERFDDFVETNAQAEDALDELDALRECDSGDELYAEFVLNPQEISIAGVPSPSSGSLLGKIVMGSLSFLAIDGIIMRGEGIINKLVRLGQSRKKGTGYRDAASLNRYVLLKGGGKLERFAVDVGVSEEEVIHVLELSGRGINFRGISKSTGLSIEKIQEILVRSKGKEN